MGAIALRAVCGVGVQSGKGTAERIAVFQCAEAGIDGDRHVEILEIVADLRAFIGETGHAAPRCAAETVQRRAAAFAADKPAVRQVVARGEAAACGDRVAIKRHQARQAGVAVRALARAETTAEATWPGRGPIWHRILFLKHTPPTE